MQLRYVTLLRTQMFNYKLWMLQFENPNAFEHADILGLGLGLFLSHGKTENPAVARDGRPYWPSRKTVIPSWIGLAAVLGVEQLSWLVKLIVHWLTAYCPSTLYRATLGVINSACLLTCDTSHTNSDQHPQFICSHKDAGYYNFGRRLSCYVMQTNKHLQFI